MPTQQPKRDHAGQYPRQYPSRTARRTHTKGNGLVKDFPEPKGSNLIYCDPDNFLTDVPIEGRWGKAAELRRFLWYGGKYQAINDRLPKDEQFNARNLPEAYGPTESCIAFLSLLGRFMRLSTRTSFLHGAKAGILGQTVGGVTHAGTPHRVAPSWGISKERMAVEKGVTPELKWSSAAEGRFVTCHIARPIQVGYFRGEDGVTVQEQWPGETASIVCEVGGLREGIDCCYLAIQILLWGACYAPTDIKTGARHWWDQFPEGYGLEEWGDWIEVVAGRAICQMVHVREAINRYNLINLESGGRGGIVGKADRKQPVRKGKAGPRAKHPKPRPAPKPKAKP